MNNIEELQELLLSCGVTEEEPKEIPKVVIRTEKKVKSCVKYVNLGGRSREEKYAVVLKETISRYSIDFMLWLNENDLYQVKFSRPYGKSFGGPVVFVGEKQTPRSSKDEVRGRDKFHEINSRFPIQEYFKCLDKYHEMFIASQTQCDNSHP